MLCIQKIVFLYSRIKFQYFYKAKIILFETPWNSDSVFESMEFVEACI